jgi:hypothetical protein
VASFVAILLTASLLASPPLGTLPEGPSPGPDAIATPLLGWQPAPTPPGGYWSLGERSEPEPPDGHDAITIGSVIFSLGLIRAGAGAAAVYMATRPELCAVDCRSTSAFGWAGVGFGALMFTSGLISLSIGLAQRAKRERWQRGELSLVPWSTRSHASRSLGLAFGLRF